MPTLRRNTAAVLACGLLTAAGTANAQDLVGPYVGISLGTLDHEENDDGRVELNANTDVERIFGGYRIARHIAIEGAWTVSGDLRENASGAFPSIPNAQLEMEYEILAIKAVAFWPIRRFGFLHGLGYYDADSDVSVTRNGTQLLTLEEPEQGLVFFGGFSFDLERFSLRAEYQWHENLNGADVTDITAGAAFRF